MNWIKCDEQMPPIDKDVLVFVNDKYKNIYVAHFTGSEWYCFCECIEGSSVKDVTHWMPLPKIPEW